MAIKKVNTSDLPPWVVIPARDSVLPYKPKLITSIEDMPDNVYGFIYEITFIDGMIYIGKKNLYSIRTLPALKSGKVREGAERIHRNTGKGFRKAFDVVKIESNWKVYCGSHAECKIRIPKQREILQYAFNKLELTYLEAKYLFINEVLERDDYINDNILGSFYRSSFYDISN